MTPHPSPLHPARHRINVLCARGIVAAGLGMATLGGLLGAVPAVASPQLTSAQDRATQLRHTVDDLRVRTEQAAEAYDAAAAGLAAAVTEHGLADRQLTQAHADAAAGENTMAARVRSLYVSGGPTALYASVLESHDLSDVFSRFRSVRAVAEGDQAVVDQADAALTHSGQVESALADAADRQNRLERAAAAAAAQVGQLLEQEAGVLAGADADVVRIAEADRKAEQEAAERAFQAQLTAAQATVAQAARLAAQAAATAHIGSGSQPGVGVAPAATELGRAALAEAVRQIGKPYVWGAVGADSFDCSGLTQWAYARAGVRPLGQSGAVEGVCADGAPHVGFPDLPDCLRQRRSTKLGRGRCHSHARLRTGADVGSGRRLGRQPGRLGDGSLGCGQLRLESAFGCLLLRLAVSLGDPNDVGVRSCQYAGLLLEQLANLRSGRDRCALQPVLPVGRVRKRALDLSAVRQRRVGPVDDRLVALRHRPDAAEPAENVRKIVTCEHGGVQGGRAAGDVERAHPGGHGILPGRRVGVGLGQLPVGQAVLGDGGGEPGGGCVIGLGGLLRSYP